MSKLREQKHAGITWIDIEKPSRSDLEVFAKKYNFSPTHIDECLTEGQLPQAEVGKEYVFLLLYSPALVSAENKISTSQVGVFLGKDYLITVHGTATPSITKLFAATEFNDDIRGEYFRKSAGYLLYKVIANLLNDLSELMPPVLKELDDIEDQVFDSKGSDAFVIGQLRQKIMKLRRITAAVRTMLEDLSDNIGEFGGVELARYYEHNNKVTKRLWETVEEATETIEIYKDADFTANTEKTNDILAVLTLLFTLTIPATVIGTFYGMNILLPGGIDAGHWTFWGEYTTFKLVSLASLLSALVMFWFFRKKRWF